MKKVGDFVKIKGNADEIRRDHWNTCVTPYMCREYAGNTGKIIAVEKKKDTDQLVYNIDSWWWEEYYFESLGNFKCNSLI